MTSTHSLHVSLAPFPLNFTLDIVDNKSRKMYSSMKQNICQNEYTARLFFYIEWDANDLPNNDYVLEI